MPMPKALHDLLSEKLGDAKYEEKPVLDILTDWEDGNGAKVKVQEANRDLTARRDAAEKDLKASKDALAAKEKEVERLQNNMLSDEDRANFEKFKKSGMTSEKEREMEAKMNALTDKLDTAATQIQTLTQSVETERQNTARATEANAHTQLKGDVVAALAKQGIKNPANQALAMHSIIAEGQATIAKDDNGGFVQKYIVTKNGKPLEATIDELAETFAKAHEALVDASGNMGPGQDHNSYASTGNVLTDPKASRGQLEDEAARLMAAT